jgi:glycosyltransferase involved in cell wall biosynthesis
MSSDVLEYSIVVPTYQRRDSLARCLKAIAALEFPRGRFELIVVDDGSPAPPADLIASLASLDPTLQARLVCAAHGGPAAARNAGAHIARGRYLVFTDDDCAPHRGWLQAIDHCLAAASGPSTVIGGQTLNVLADNPYATASQGIVDFLYDYFGERSTPRQFFTSNNLVIPRDGFIAIGGFDDGFHLAAAEDRDLCERWNVAGGELRFAADVVVDHAHALDFTRFNRQHFNYGRGAFDLHRSRASRGSSSLRLEPVRFYFGLITYPMRRTGGWRSVPLSFLHFWSQVAYATGYFYERTRRGWSVQGGDDHDSSTRAPRGGTRLDRTDQGSMTGAA